MLLGPAPGAEGWSSRPSDRQAILISVALEKPMPSDGATWGGVQTSLKNEGRRGGLLRGVVLREIATWVAYNPLLKKSGGKVE